MIFSIDNYTITILCLISCDKLTNKKLIEIVI